MRNKKYRIGLTLLALTAALGAATPSWAQVITTAPPAPVPAEVPATTPAAATQDADTRALIRDLGDANAAVSDPAQKKLDALPRASLEKIWAAEQQMMEDGSIKVRAMDRLSAWEEKLALTPTQITLDMKDKPIDDILDEISRQAGVSIRTQPPKQYRNNGNPSQKDKLYSLHVDKQPFWLAIRELSTQTGMTVDNYGGNDNSIQLNLYSQGESTLNVVAGDTPLHIAANSIDRSYRTNLQTKDEKNRTTNTFVIHLTGLADPALQVVNNTWKTDVTEATDDKGHSLLPEKDKNRNGMFMGGFGSTGWLCNSTIPLKYPASDAGEKIKTLKGTLTVEVVIRQNHAVFDDLKTPTTAEFGEMDLNFDGIKSQGDRNFTVSVKFAQGGAPNNVWQNMGQWGRGPTIKLLDAAGKPYGQNGTSTSGGGTAWTFQPNFYRNDNDPAVKIGPPAKVVITMAAKTKTITVPFEFHDLKLP